MSSLTASVFNWPNLLLPLPEELFAASDRVASSSPFKLIAEIFRASQDRKQAPRNTHLLLNRSSSDASTSKSGSDSTSCSLTVITAAHTG